MSSKNEEGKVTDKEIQQNFLEKLRAAGYSVTPCNFTNISDTDATYHFSGGRVVEREGSFWINFLGVGHGTPMIIKKILPEEYENIRSKVLHVSVLLEKYKEQEGDANKSRVIEERWRKLGIWDA
jgi:hypothetical protein